MCRTVALFLVFTASAALAQERGFRVHRYEGTAAGTSTFLVDRPWYTSTRGFSAGLTGDYSHRALGTLLDHAVVGHVDIAGALFDRLQLSASLPVTFLELGTAQAITQFTPLQTVGTGDPRVGLMVRIAGQPDVDPISLNLGADVWIPVGAAASHQGDTFLRAQARAVLAGSFLSVGRWALEGGFHYRPYASYGPPELGLIAGSEARVGASLGLSLAKNRLYLGPEVQFSTQVAGDSAWKTAGMNLELLGGLTYVIADRVLIGVAGGTALLGSPGTPDARAMVRIAWAPRPSVDEAKPEDVTSVDAGVAVDEADPDGDGIPTVADRCPYESETKNGVRDQDGCPEFEMAAGSPLAKVLAPSVVAAPIDAGVVAKVVQSVDAGASVDAKEAAVEARAKMFATADSDGDGIPDEADRCPVAKEDKDEFEDEDGCPELDNDQDGIADVSDFCVDAAESVNGVDDDDGCPDAAPDADGDQVADAIDRCPLEPENRDGVRDEDGCPEYQGAGLAALPKLLAATSVQPPTLDVEVESGAKKPALGSTDSDSDGVKDEEDRCPVQAEDSDGFEDEDGCREPDNDDDGVPDAQDKCVDEAENYNGTQDEDGCPDVPVDVDGDGFAYEADRCPLEPGVSPDGCPHEPAPLAALTTFVPAKLDETKTAEPVVAPAPITTDFDKDGLTDDADACPLVAEDRDDFEDEDGCAEADNDRDGLEDAKDKCPLVAETINGINDEDGCPDVGAGAVTVEKDAVVIKGIIQFKIGKADLQPASLPLVKQVASTLRAASSLSVEIQGHTDDVGNAAANVKLSKKRAEAIRAVLIKAGVSPTRLVANGYGPKRPIASNKTAAGREKNRRVEFLIIGATK